MDKNKIFLGAIGVAFVVAAAANAMSPNFYHQHGEDWDVRINDGDGNRHGNRHYGRGHGQASVEFNGKSYKCDAETGKVELEHEDGSKTVVTCD
ncbi:MAG: hypothetical protein JKY60_13370 [Kordiimonadaceae bacterium]|nr:hypothetical protein [Kordiimonadaceae bacterium]